MGKRVLIVGAGNQVARVISQADELDLSVVLLDESDARVGDTRDPFVHESITGATEIKIAARRNSVDGIFAATDRAVAACALAAKECGLPGTDPLAAEHVSDRSKVREALATSGRATPQFRAASNAAQAVRFARDLTFPVVVKPAIGAALGGLSYVEHEEDISLAFLRARKRSPNGPILIEEYVWGTELVIDGFVVDGRFNLVGVARRLRPDPPALYETALLMPANVDANKTGAATDAADELTRSMGYNYGSLRVELILREDTPVVLKFSGCSCGGQRHTDLAKYARGVSALGVALAMSVGNAPANQATIDRGAALSYVSARTGIVTRVDGFAEVQAFEGVVDAALNARPGNRIGHGLIEPTQMRIGYAVAVADSASDALTIARRACEKCVVTTRPTLDAVD